MWKTLGGFAAEMSRFAYILPSKTAQIHCGAVGLVFLRRSYIATGRLPHGQPPPPLRGPMPKDADARTRMARKLRSKKGSAIYAQC
jgi:hypothetical protein